MIKQRYRMALPVKVFLLLAGNLFIMIPLTYLYEIVFFMYLFILFIFDYEISLKNEIKYLNMFVVLHILQYVFSMYSNISFFRFLTLLIYAFLRIFPCSFIAKNIISTVRVDEIYYNFKKYKIKIDLAIPFMIFIRLFPVAFNEFKELIFQSKMRNNKIKIKEFFSIVIVLITNIVVVGDDLTKAAMTKGVGYCEDRSYYKVYNLEKFDYFLLLSTFSLIVFFLWSM